MCVHASRSTSVGFNDAGKTTAVSYRHNHARDTQLLSGYAQPIHRDTTTRALRAGFEAVPAIQHENAYVLGLSQFQAFTHVTLPQAAGMATPGVVANVIFLIKQSSVVSAIALADVMYMAKDLMDVTYNTYESLFMLIVAYLVILLPVSLMGTWLERKFDYARR
ncbi:hypothetical protein BIFGAL_03152 [Bifidobacterium gallicum DSM 20093 = LMG 11596]|uniref:Amino acid ABC transporter, permease protein n=1 Tax=Bifidobacterium gallicum DSM 20093 = LMG 11596 TaxID=561180 RepID=D1NTJ4_9BIFI|nr:hypothetical protein BIFGAL_03152 [Bifidobacterium gallicum DSM 20093 = LMG 11596]KFI57647.1 amino acid ABC transporter, permease protein [Bifidobacterium gallicum DSM 20093 = LMG 11596]